VVSDAHEQSRYTEFEKKIEKFGVFDGSKQIEYERMREKTKKTTLSLQNLTILH
jgi:hypothetical protein